MRQLTLRHILSRSLVHRRARSISALVALMAILGFVLRSRKSGDTSYRTGTPGRRPWSLQMSERRWRIATPVRLEMRADCAGHPFGASGCVDALSIRFAAG